MTVREALVGGLLPLVARRLGAEVPEIRQADLEEALRRELGASAVSSPEAYLARLAALPDGSPEWEALLPAVTVGETYFFRDPERFEALERHVLAPLIAERRAHGAPFLRIWSAGCATGEEPYSIAILLDRLLPDRQRWSLTLRGTDIHRHALEAARRGIFRPWAFRATPASLRDRYFEPRGRDAFALRPEIRAMVTFDMHNLADAAPALPGALAGWDLILCRNVLMYFTAEARRAAVGQIERALRPGGWLVVAPAECSVDLMAPLTAVALPGAVLYRKEPVALAPGASGRALLSTPESLHAELGGRLLAPPPGLPGEPRPVTPNVPFVGTPGPDPRDDLARARALADRGELGEARRLGQAALARDPSDLDAHLLLAAIADACGDEAGAIEALRRALYLDPDSAVAHFLLGSLLLRRGDVGRARRSLETAVRVLAAAAPDLPVEGAGDACAAEILERARALLALVPARGGRD